MNAFRQNLLAAAFATSFFFFVNSALVLIRSEAESSVQEFLEHGFTNRTETVFCMMDILVNEDILDEVYAKLSEHNEIIGEEIEAILQGVEKRCNRSFYSSTLGVVTILSGITIILAFAFLCARRLIKR